MDRPAFSILSQLGFIPEEVMLDAIEITGSSTQRSQISKLVGPQNLGVIVCSDAHQLDQIGTRCTKFFLEEPSLEEIKLALGGRKGRRVVI